MDDIAWSIPTETEVACNRCDHEQTVTIWDDIRTGDWAYLFECSACDAINDEHGNNLERGSADLFTILLLVGVGLIFWGIIAHFNGWLLIAGAWVLAIRYTIAAIHGGRITNEGHDQ